MKTFRFFTLLALAALLMLLNRPASSVANKPVKVHILYSSDAVGYHEPCG